MISEEGNFPEIKKPLTRIYRGQNVRMTSVKDEKGSKEKSSFIESKSAKSASVMLR
jgi:hypothetical protein